MVNLVGFDMDAANSLKGQAVAGVPELLNLDYTTGSMLPGRRSYGKSPRQRDSGYSLSLSEFGRADACKVIGGMVLGGSAGAIVLRGPTGVPDIVECLPGCPSEVFIKKGVACHA